VNQKKSFLQDSWFYVFPQNNCKNSVDYFEVARKPWLVHNFVVLRSDSDWSMGLRMDADWMRKPDGCLWTFNAWQKMEFQIRKVNRFITRPVFYGVSMDSLKFLLGLTMPYHPTPCRWPPAGCAACGRLTSPLDTPSHAGLFITSHQVQELGLLCLCINILRVSKEQFNIVIKSCLIFQSFIFLYSKLRLD
jgi:hypothetical protein